MISSLNNGLNFKVYENLSTEITEYMSEKDLIYLNRMLIDEEALTFNYYLRKELTVISRNRSLLTRPRSQIGRPPIRYIYFYRLNSNWIRSTFFISTSFRLEVKKSTSVRLEVEKTTSVRLEVEKVDPNILVKFFRNVKKTPKNHQKIWNWICE